MTLLELARQLDTGEVLEAEIIVVAPDPPYAEFLVVDAYIGLSGQVALRTRHKPGTAQKGTGWLTVAEEASNEK